MGHRSPPVVANARVVVVIVAATAAAVVKQATVLGSYNQPPYPLPPTPSHPYNTPLRHGPRPGKFFDYALVKVASFSCFVALVSFVHAKNKRHMFPPGVAGREAVCGRRGVALKGAYANVINKQ